MASSLRRLLPLGAVALLVAAGACTSEHAGPGALTQAVASAPARITLRLAPGQLPAAGVSLSRNVMAADEDSGSADDSSSLFVHVDSSDVDSLVVNVTQVQIRGNGGEDEGPGGPESDSARADSGREGHDSTSADSSREGGDSTRADSGRTGGDSSSADTGRSDVRVIRVLASDNSGEGSDSARGRDDNEGHDGWITLNVTGSGHLNLLRLPTSSDSGLLVASDSVPPGTYEHLRLFVTGPMIFFKKTIVTATGDTLKAGTGYPVFIPSADSTGAAMRTDESFVIPSGGGTVPVFFDKDDTIRHIVITGDGKIIVPPVIR